MEFHGIPWRYFTRGVNKSPFRYGFPAGARPLRYSVVIALDKCFGNDRERTKREA